MYFMQVVEGVEERITTLRVHKLVVQVLVATVVVAMVLVDPIVVMGRRERMATVVAVAVVGIHPPAPELQVVPVARES